MLTSFTLVVLVTALVWRMCLNDSFQTKQGNRRFQTPRWSRAATGWTSLSIGHGDKPILLRTESLLHRLFLAIVYRNDTHTHTHARLTALSLGLPGSACIKKVKPTWILLEQQTVSGSGISWAICKPIPCSRQITKFEMSSFIRSKDIA